MSSSYTNSLLAYHRKEIDLKYTYTTMLKIPRLAEWLFHITMFQIPVLADSPVLKSASFLLSSHIFIMRIDLQTI